EQLGYPGHHMEEVDPFSPEQLALWTAAAAGRPVDWSRAYAGYSAAADWPTAALRGELLAGYPEARFLLTLPDPQDWYRRFSQTIYPLVDPTGNAPPALHPFGAIVRAVMRKTGFVVPSPRTELLEAYERHVRRIQNLVPAERLLIFDGGMGTPLRVPGQAR